MNNHHKPAKRDSLLAPLSREHHHTLILAQVLKKSAHGYKDLPVSDGERIKYAMSFFREQLLPHFHEEEIMMKKVIGCNAEVDALCKEISQEHIRLETLFEGLIHGENAEAALNELGMLLEQHIRKEERRLFPMIQDHCLQKLI